MEAKLIFSLSIVLMSINLSCGQKVKVLKQNSEMSKDIGTTSIETTSTYSRESSYFSDITATQNLEIAKVVTRVLETPDVNKDNTKVWFFANKDERFEVSLYLDEIKVEFESNIKGSKEEKKIEDLIEEINQVINSRN